MYERLDSDTAQENNGTGGPSNNSAPIDNLSWISSETENVWLMAEFTKVYQIWKILIQQGNVTAGNLLLILTLIHGGMKSR